MSWAQEGREHKAKEMAKAEEYAVKEVGGPSKRKPRPHVVEVRYTEDYIRRAGTIQILKRDGTIDVKPCPWVHGEWRTYRKYAVRRAAREAVDTLNAKEGNCREYRVRPEG